MKIFNKIIIFFLLSISVANAQEKQSKEIFLVVITTGEIIDTSQEQQNEIFDNKVFDSRVSVYLHPFTTIPSLTQTLSTVDGADCYLYATVEVPLNLSIALIIRPSYWDGTNFIKDIFPIFGGYYGKRLGCDIGIRYYPGEKGKGFYLQGQIGTFYYKERIHSWGSGWFGGSSGNDAVYMWVDVTGYIGKVWQYGDRTRLLLDFGLGCANLVVKFISIQILTLELVLRLAKRK